MVTHINATLANWLLLPGVREVARWPGLGSYMSAAAKSSQTVSGDTWHGSGNSVFATA